MNDVHKLAEDCAARILDRVEFGGRALLKTDIVRDVEATLREALQGAQAPHTDEPTVYRHVHRPVVADPGNPAPDFRYAPAKPTPEQIAKICDKRYLSSAVCSRVCSDDCFLYREILVEIIIDKMKHG